MLKQFVCLVSLVLCACGQNPVSETAAVTNGDLVLGIVPLEGGASAKDQRYRLLVCQKLPQYSVQALTDDSVCRSALLTQDGEEVDLVGDKLDEAHKDVLHLPVKAAAEARVLEAVPLYGKYAYALNPEIAFSGVFNPGTALVGIGGAFLTTGTILMLGKGLMLAGILTTAPGAFIVGTMGYTLIKYYQEHKERKERMVRIGDEGKRINPTPVIISPGGIFAHATYSSGDTLADKYFDDITSYDIHDETSLEQKEDLRAIVVALARFYQLQANEAAFQF